MHLQLLYVRMESTEKCEAIIQHFNGKYIKTPPGVAGTMFALFFILSFVLTRWLWQINNKWYVVIKCLQNPCCVNLRMGGRRNVRIRGNITRMGGSGWERARLWESCFFLLFSCWFQSQVLIQLSLSRSYTHTGRDDANIWPYSCFTKWVGSEIITQEMLYFVLLIMTLHGNSSFFKKMCLSPPAGFTLLPTALLLTEFLLRLLSLPTCTHPYPPTRYGEAICFARAILLLNISSLLKMYSLYIWGI